MFLFLMLVVTRRICTAFIMFSYVAVQKKKKNMKTLELINPENDVSTEETKAKTISQSIRWPRITVSQTNNDYTTLLAHIPAIL